MRSILGLSALCLFGGCLGRVSEANSDPVIIDQHDETSSCVDVPATPLRRLTRAEYKNTIRDLFGITASTVAFPSDGDVEHIFPANWDVVVEVAHARAYMSAAEHIGAEVASDLDRHLDCDDGRDCAERFARSLIRNAWRRPPADEDVNLLLEVWEVGSSFRDGIRLMVEVVLQAPDFLYLVEHAEPGMLSDHEVAARLSYFLWGTTPDEALLATADAGALQAAHQVEAEARRMLADPRAEEMLVRFHQEWLGLYGEPEPDDPNQALHRAMMAETRSLILDVFVVGDGRLESLFESTRAELTPALAELYGVDPTPTGTTEFDGVTRTGILTRADFLSGHPPPNSVVHRGVAIRDRVFCSPLGDPPPAATDSGDDRTDVTTVCYSCHSLVDPVGNTLSHYDALGRFRSEVDGAPVVAEGSLPVTDVEGSLYGGVELSAAIARSEQARDCAATQWTRFALGRPVGESDSCHMDQIAESFSQNRGNVRELIAQIVRSDLFRRRGLELSEAGR